MNNEDREKMIKRSQLAAKRKHSRLQKKVDEFGALDEDGYPTIHSLRLIEGWCYLDDTKNWFKFINSIWHLKSWGWREVYGEKDHYNDEVLPETTLRYFISTAGWSGNESIIKAMGKSYFWHDSWVESRRGGHYVFQLDEES